LAAFQLDLPKKSKMALNPTGLVVFLSFEPLSELLKRDYKIHDSNRGR